MDFNEAKKKMDAGCRVAEASNPRIVFAKSNGKYIACNFDSLEFGEVSVFPPQQAAAMDWFIVGLA